MTMTPSEHSARPAGGVPFIAGFWANYRSVVIAGLGIALVALTSVALHHLLADLSYGQLTEALVATPWWAVALSLAFTAVSFAALIVYDRQGLLLIGKTPPLPVVAMASFSAYAVGNVAGFGPLTGGTLRYRFYARLGLSPEDIAKVVAYVTVAFGVGLAFVTAVGAIVADHALAQLTGLTPVVLRVTAAVVVSLVLALVIAAALGTRSFKLAGRTVTLPDARGQVLQLAGTSIDIAAAAAALWILLPAGAPHFGAFLAAYAVAVGLGVLSHVPGGLGVFETVMIGTVGQTVPLQSMVGALVLYRVIYNVVPLFTAIAIVAATEVRRIASDNPILAKASAGLLPLVLATGTVLLGAMLILSGVTPTTDAKLDVIQAALPLPLVEGAHFLASVLGVFLILAGRGLVHRLDGAWWVATLVTAASIPLALLKGLAVGEALILGVLLVALVLGRSRFDRPASLTQDRLTPGWWLCVGTILVSAAAILLFVYREVDYSHELWWQFEFTATAPRSLRAALGIGLAAAAASVWYLVRPPGGSTARPTEDDLRRAVAIAERQPVADANLVRMGDKSLMFSSGGEAFIMYGKRGRSWVALFDPVGDPAAWPELIFRFVETARTHGGRAVFYQVGAAHLALYADAGLSAFKLGEEAMIPLADFDLKGPRRSGLRNAINKTERDGIVFEVIPAGAVAGLLGDLRAVSDAWLAQHEVKEKGFSLGAFDDAYVASQPVAVLRKAGRIIAFATIAITGLKEEASVDLMRFEPGSPNGCMETLFAKLLMHFKAEGYAWFSLGMAPLSGLSENPAAPLWHRVGRSVFEHGEAFYNFRGLRAFKGKFDPQWRPRYLAVAGGLNPPIALADVTLLISGSLRGTVSK